MRFKIAGIALSALIVTSSAFAQTQQPQTQQPQTQQPQQPQTQQPQQPQTQQPQTPQTQQPAQRELPSTASPAPLIALVGTFALGSGIALTLIRRRRAV